LELFVPFLADIWNRDPYLACADFASYAACQDAAGRQFMDPDGWDRMAILNVARIGRFSSDRAVREYSEEIWRVAPVPIQVA
ncbi:MAG: glycogen/starch/alpha-glucan phosphorylase, partial [Gallionellaceae bacterium]|nr:glycogen/starch/alpha-glucan phosphorylase [Gallionellaceae bacterium]